MLVLALDTSTPCLSVALTAADGRVLAQRDELAPNRHGERLAPLIDEVIAEAKAARTDLAAIAVGLGPGPFTGLRVGIVTAAAMSDALGIPMYGAGSLDALAAAHHGDSDVLAVTDARRKQVYWARYDGSGARRDGPEIDPPHDLAERFRGSVPRVAGAGALLHRDAFAGFAVDDRSPHPRAADLAALVRHRVESNDATDKPDPLYLRRPDARPPGAPKKVTPR